MYLNSNNIERFILKISIPKYSIFCNFSSSNPKNEFYSDSCANVFNIILNFTVMPFSFDKHDWFNTIYVSHCRFQKRRNNFFFRIKYSFTTIKYFLTICVLIATSITNGLMRFHFRFVCKEKMVNPRGRKSLTRRLSM